MGASTRASDSLSPTSLTCLTWQTPRNAPLPGTSSNPVQIMHATLALNAGVHPKVVSERLGHATTGITLDLYSHVTPGIARDAADAVAATNLHLTADG